MNNNSSAFFITSDDVVPSCCKARKIIDSSLLFPNPKNDKCKSSSAAFTAVVWAAWVMHKAGRKKPLKDWCHYQPESHHCSVKEFQTIHMCRTKAGRQRLFSVNGIRWWIIAYISDTITDTCTTKKGYENYVVTLRGGNQGKGNFLLCWSSMCEWPCTLHLSPEWLLFNAKKVVLWKQFCRE